MLNKFCEMLANVPREMLRTLCKKREPRNGTRVNTLSKVEDYLRLLLRLCAGLL